MPAVFARAGAGLTAHHGDDDDLAESSAAEGFGAFVYGGSGGEDVVDEDDSMLGGVEPAAAVAGEIKGTAEVGHALRTAEARLAVGRSSPAQRVEHGQSEVDGQRAGDFLGLVEVAVAQAASVERHGHQRPSFGQALGQSRVGEGFAGEQAQLGGQVDFAGVFQPVNELESSGVARGGGSGEGEGK